LSRSIAPRFLRVSLNRNCFGHERGAFTGAIAPADWPFRALRTAGTIFLDEVGDISLELQPKLLRVLQEQEFERLGSTQTIRVDVRLVAATNRDLGEMVAARTFRSDLYYRLRVFPLSIRLCANGRKTFPRSCATLSKNMPGA